MAIRDLRTCCWALSLVVVAAAACGPDPAQTASATNTSTGNDASSADSPTGGSTDGPTGSSTSAPEPCSQVYEGDLYISDETDLASLADIGRVTGGLQIAMKERDQRDLAFLSCLHTVDGLLKVNYNTLLESTAGLESLTSVYAIQITENPNLRVVTGFDQILSISWLFIRTNPALEEIQLDSLEAVNEITLGECDGINASAKHLVLADLSGFSGLTTAKYLTIDGNEALMSADLLDALATNGSPAPIAVATIRFNPLLSEATVHARLDALGVAKREVCGNSEGDPECFCKVGE